MTLAAASASVPQTASCLHTSGCSSCPSCLNAGRERDVMMGNQRVSTRLAVENRHIACFKPTDIKSSTPLVWIALHRILWPSCPSVRPSIRQRKSSGFSSLVSRPGTHGPILSLSPIRLSPPNDSDRVRLFFRSCHHNGIR